MLFRFLPYMYYISILFFWILDIMWLIFLIILIHMKRIFEHKNDYFSALDENKDIALLW